MKRKKQCFKCGVELTNDNWYPGSQKHKKYICKECHKKYPKTKKYTKSLYSDAKDGVQIKIQLLYYPKSDHIGFVIGFQKSGTNGGSKTNKSCTMYLGVTIAEKVLSKVFKNVERMPSCNKGYDIICNQGYLIDIKSSCRYIRKNQKHSDSWTFRINKNIIADYFLCLAFDNRESLNPEYVWLIPGKDVNDKTGINISESKLDKWDHYQIDKMEEIIKCCDILRTS